MRRRNAAIHTLVFPARAHFLQGAVPQQNPADAAALAATLASSLAQPGWCSGASVALRWWSAGSLEPLRAEPTDRLLVQVC